MPGEPMVQLGGAMAFCLGCGKEMVPGQFCAGCGREQVQKDLAAPAKSKRGLALLVTLVLLTAVAIAITNGVPQALLILRASDSTHPAANAWDSCGVNSNGTSVTGTEIADSYMNHAQNGGDLSMFWA